MTFQDVCKSLGVPFREAHQHHHVGPGYCGVECGRCSPGSNKFKAGYNLRGRFMTCWTCGKLDVATTLARAAGRRRQEVLALLAGLSAGPVKEVTKPTGEYLPPGHFPLSTNHPHAHAVRRYLKKRGYDPEGLSRLWHVGATQPAEMPYRVFIPVVREGRKVSWTSRAISDGVVPRYRNSTPERESYPLKHCLYGLDYVRGAAVVVEGVFDAWRIGPGAVATFGVSFTREQVLLLSKVPVRAIAYDAEDQAQTQASKLCALLEAFPGVTYQVRLESGKDPGVASKEEITEIRKRFLEA